MTFYTPISVREAVEHVNYHWFLPAVQRPYDWGERYKKKYFIKSLFDSILREYPIGTLIIWDTPLKIPYREFLREFDSRTLAPIQSPGKWGGKQLIYDGQQRLQSLYSCLKHNFERDILCFDLLFNKCDNREPEGFEFFKLHQKIEPRYLRLDELYKCKDTSRNKIEFRHTLKERIGELSTDENTIFEDNFDTLWKLFVGTEVKLLSYYPIKKDFTKEEVLDIFKRINTTGMRLTNSEILFSKIKSYDYLFEEKIWKRSKKIEEHTGGFSFDPDDILQLIYLIKIGSMKVDPERVDESDLKDFKEIWDELETPLQSFFSDFLFGEFRINRSNIVNSKNALVPIILFFYYMRKKHNIKYVNFSHKSKQNLKKYFILSQLKDWWLQSYIDNTKILIEKKITGLSEKEFPFIELRNLADKKRDIELNSDDLVESQWFSLKILTPKRQYHFVGDADARFNPEKDHIFPLHPDTEEPFDHEKYNELIDILWNLQPIKGDINEMKDDGLPQVFFEKNPEYLELYDHLPSPNIRDEIWLFKNVDKFVNVRKKKMLSFIEKEYGVYIKEVRE